MTAPVLTHAASRLIDDCAAHRAALAGLSDDAAADADAVRRETGWMEALEHLARRGGLSHAGLAEAREVVAASRDWVREWSAGGPGRGR